MFWTAKLVKSLIFDKNKKKSNLIFSISSFAIALSIAIMIIASFMIRGFEHTIEHKVFNFWSHYHILPFSLAQSIESTPFVINPQIIKKLEQEPHTLAVQKTILKGAILRKKDQFEGVLVKGVEIEKIKPLIMPYVIRGDFKALDSFMPIVISDKLSSLLHIPYGKTCYLSFINEDKSLIKCRVVGLFHTGMEEFDNSLIMTNIEELQKIENWPKNKISELEIYIKDPNKIKELKSKYYQKIESQELDLKSIYELYPHIFDWLELMKQNEMIIFIVLLIVACINIISTISIFVLEKVHLTGILKVLGANHQAIRMLFFYQMLYIIIRGFLWGNIIAIGLSYLQYTFHLIKLDEQMYYTSYAPIMFDWNQWFLINFVALIICIITTFVPLMMINRMSPIKITEFK